MNSQQIEYFFAAVKHLNFSKAAEELHTSQSTVSRQLALLEEELGTQLFAREKGAMRLTAGGAIMVQEFGKIQSCLSDAARRVERANAGLEGRISIGYLSNMDTDKLVYPPSFEFSMLYPAIDMKLESATFSELRRKLGDGSYDIVFTYNFELPTYENIQHKKVYAVSPMIVMSKRHTLATKGNIRPSDLDGQCFLLPDRDESRGRVTDIHQICEELGVKGVTLRFLSNIETMLFGIRSGWGLGLLSSGMDCMFDSRYVCVPISKLKPSMDVEVFVAMVWNRDNTNPVIPLYIDFFAE